MAIVLAALSCLTANEKSDLDRATIDALQMERMLQSTDLFEDSNRTFKEIDSEDLDYEGDVLTQESMDSATSAEEEVPEKNSKP